MRITTRIDDELLAELREQARREGATLTKIINQVLRLGIDATRKSGKGEHPYREKTFDMGQPRLPLDKALALAASLEDEEILKKLAGEK